MSWHSKVLWSEGLFLKPQHFQQADRYVEGFVKSRVSHTTPYPWGFSDIEIDRDLAQRSKFGLRRACGILPDGTPFDLPGNSPALDPIDITAEASNQLVWLTLPMEAVNTREVDHKDRESASRYFSAPEIFIDSTADLRQEEEIDVAHPRLVLKLGRAPKAGYVNIAVARILEVRDRTVLIDEKFVPPLLVTMASPVVTGWIDRVIGWLDTKLEELARYAADPTAGGGLQSVDYLILQLLNRSLPVFRHMRGSAFVHPERLYIELLRLAGELATFAAPDRRARVYAPYDHDDLEGIFAPVLRDIQDYLSARLGRRVIRLEIVERAANAFISIIRDRSLFRTATFVLEVGADRPLADIQTQFPHLFKVGPNSKMNEIVNAHLPGIALLHMPTPPQQIRALTNHVYFHLDKSSPLWGDFSTATSIGMHFSGDWPGLALELWAVLEDRR